MSSSSAIHLINTLITMTTTTMTWLARVGGETHQHNDHNNNNNNSWILLSALFCSLFGVCIFLLAKRLTQQRQQGRRALRKGVQFGAMVGFWFQLALCTALVTLYRSLASYWESNTEEHQQQQASSLFSLLARVIFTPAIVPALAFVFLITAYLSIIVMACRHSFNSYWTGALSAVSIQLGLWTGLGYTLLQMQQEQQDAMDVDISENSTYMGLVVVVGLVPLMLLRLAQCCWCSSSQADEEFWSNRREEEMSEPLLLLSEGRRQQQQKLAAADNKETEYDEATCCWKQNSGLAYVQQMGGLGYASLV